MPQQPETKFLQDLTEVPAGWPLATVIDAFAHLAIHDPSFPRWWICGLAAGAGRKPRAAARARRRRRRSWHGNYGWHWEFSEMVAAGYPQIPYLRARCRKLAQRLVAAESPETARKRQKLEEETAERPRLEAELQKSQEEGRELRNRLAAAEAEVSSKDAELRAAQSESAKCKEQCKEFAARAAAAEAGPAEMQKELRQVQEEQGRCQERCEEFATRLQAFEAEASEHADTQQRLARAEAYVAEQRLAMQRLEMENLSLKAGSQQAETGSTELQVEKAVLQDRCEQLQQQLAEARGQLEVLWQERGMYQERLRQLAEMNKKQGSQHHRLPTFHPPGPAPSDTAFGDQESDLMDEDLASVQQQNCFMLDAIFKCRMDVLREGRNLQIGSQVLAGDGETVLEVVEIKEARTTEVVDLKAGAATLRVTPDHSVPIPNAEGKAGGHHCLPAGKLKVGDFVMNSSGEPVALTTAKTLPTECNVLKIVFKPDLPVAVFPNPSSCILSKGHKKSQKRRSVRGRGQQAADPIDEGASIPDTAAGEYTD